MGKVHRLCVLGVFMCVCVLQLIYIYKSSFEYFIFIIVVFIVHKPISQMFRFYCVVIYGKFSLLVLLLFLRGIISSLVYIVFQRFLFLLFLFPLLWQDSSLSKMLCVYVCICVRDIMYYTFIHTNMFFLYNRLWFFSIQKGNPPNTRKFTKQ